MNFSSQVFECRAYIYQGWLKPGSDKTALCDSLVRIVLGSKNKDTNVCKWKIYSIINKQATGNNSKKHR
jgi:hypothetical protein